jgi:pantoate--beta-alanine ligase
MSSRNVRIPKDKREVAGKIYESLELAKTALLSSRDIAGTKNKVKEFLKKYKDLELEYFEITDSETLHPIKELEKNHQIALCIAVYLEGIRLIDNVLLSVH